MASSAFDVLTECAAPSPAAAAPPPGPLDRAEMASPKATAAVKLYQVTALPLPAEDLDGSLRVEATPAVAAVAIDGKEVGHGDVEWPAAPRPAPGGGHRVRLPPRRADGADRAPAAAGPPDLARVRARSRLVAPEA